MVHRRLPTASEVIQAAPFLERLTGTGGWSIRPPEHAASPLVYRGVTLSEGRDVYVSSERPDWTATLVVICNAQGEASYLHLGLDYGSDDDTAPWIFQVDLERMDGMEAQFADLMLPHPFHRIASPDPVPSRLRSGQIPDLVVPIAA